MSEEFELKLELDPKDIRELASEQQLADSECRSEQLLSVYYDTRGGKLRRHGYSLRVRSTPAGFVQTLKSLDAAAGLFFRGEWEVPVDSIEPRVEELAETPVADLASKTLVPIVSTLVERTLWRLNGDEGELEVSIDDGQIRANGREQSLCEIEIELKQGKPQAAFEAARRIARHVPVKLGVLSKAERGFALAEDRLAKATRAGPVFVRPDMTVAEGFSVIVQSCVRHFRLNEPLVIRDRNADALHQARVALRRLRSALTLFRPAIADEEFGRLREELRWITSQLGEARNLDVYLERVIPKSDRKHLTMRREKAYDELVDVLNSRRFGVLMVDLMAWVTLGKWRSSNKASRPLPHFAERRINRLWLKICGHDDLRVMQDEERHQLRIEVKKLRYALQFTDALHKAVGQRQKRFSKAIEALQETLGRLNDIVTARHIANQESADQSIEAPMGEEETKCIREAQKCFNRLKVVGPYWSNSRLAPTG